MRRVLPVLLACAVLPLATGCGAQDSVQNAVDPVAEAATKTEAAGTVQVAIRGKVSAAGQEMPLDGRGFFDLDAKRGALELTSSAPGAGEVRVDEVVDGLVVYIRADGLAPGLPGGKHWVKFDLEALGREQGFDIAQLQQLGGGSDPAQWLSYLKKSGDVQVLGTEDVSGAPTTHYRATIDLDRVAASAGGAASGVRRLEQITGSTTIPTEIWIDGHGRVRRQAIDYSISQPLAMSMQLTIDYERFGVPVRLTTPDSGDTVDVSDVAGR